MTTPSISDLSALREVAEKATHPGAQYLAELEASAKRLREAAEAAEGKYWHSALRFQDIGLHPVDSHFAALAKPRTVIALLDALASEKARADAAEAQSAARKTMIEGLELLVKDAEEKIAIMEGMGIDQMLSDRPIYSRRQIIERAEKAEATIASLTEQLAEAREALRMISTETKESNEPIGRSVYKALRTCGEIADLALSRLEKQEGEA